LLSFVSNGSAALPPGEARCAESGEHAIAELRLADLIAALSQVTDLGMGQPPEGATRSCLLATSLARRMDLSERDVGDIYYATLLQHIGCTAYAHETAALFGGDDIAVRAGGARIDSANPKEALPFLLFELGKGATPLGRVRAVIAAISKGQKIDEELARSNCEVAVHMTRRLGLGTGVQRGLNEIYERWDGKGDPRKLAREDIALPARFAQVASQAVLFDRLGGLELAVEVIRRRAGTALDPSIADTFLRYGRELLVEITSVDASVAVVEAEPEPHRWIAEPRLDEVARAFADLVDLKSPFMHGHSVGVSELAEAAAANLSLTEDEVVCVRRAGLLHDLGRTGVPNGIWDKPGPLTATEWEQVRLHPYHSERILSRSSALAPLASLAGMHHERQDGSGYYRQATAAMIPSGARVLAAADVYQAMTQDRPHRPPLTPSVAAEQLNSEATRGRLDAEAVRAVLEVTGHPPVRLTWPAGLSDREVQVLRLVARGHSNREIARLLWISPKTAGHHVQHIYAKIGVSTRAAAAMFAMEHDLVRN
jgi:HD-GYP domain-containing protein (c-di-GMP phosphodiesterase class II)/DNA-binding CsgD family transcriptional regulator